MDIKKALSMVDQEYMVKIRRTLHECPELGFDLPQTVQLVKTELDTMGVSYTEKYGKGSVVAVINPEKTYFTIGIRADMDALPVTEINEVPYRSKVEGKMHACGHDAHTAILLGTIRVLSQLKEEIGCRVVCIFQPAEEGPSSGAKMMVENGVMDDIDIIIGAHMENELPVGTVGYKFGQVCAISNGFIIELFGKSGHAAMPQTAVDTISMGVKIFTGIQFLNAREIDPYALRIINIGSFNAGHANNVIADYARLQGTIRTQTEEMNRFIEDRIRTMVKNAAEELGGSYHFTQSKYYPAVVNDDRATHAFIKAAEKMVDRENVIDMKLPRNGSEDFSYYQKKKPGIFYRIGSRNEQKGFCHMAHTNNWDIDEDSLAVGVKVFLQFVQDNHAGLPQTY